MCSIDYAILVQAFADAPSMTSLSDAVAAMRKVFGEVVPLLALGFFQTQRDASVRNTDVVRQAFLVLGWVVRRGEDDVQLLERAAFGLDHEEVQDGDEGGVEDSVVDVRLPSDGGE